MLFQSSCRMEDWWNNSIWSTVWWQLNRNRPVEYRLLDGKLCGRFMACSNGHESTTLQCKFLNKSLYEWSSTRLMVHRRVVKGHSFSAVADSLCDGRCGKEKSLSSGAPSIREFPKLWTVRMNPQLCGRNSLTLGRYVTDSCGREINSLYDPPWIVWNRTVPRL